MSDNHKLNNIDRSIATYRSARSLRPLSDKQLAYLAGFLDARCSITCNIIKDKNNLLWRTRISGSDKPQIKFIYNLLGLGRLNTNKSRSIITIGITDSVNLAKAMLPLSMIKWRQYAGIIQYANAMITGIEIDKQLVANNISDYNQNNIGRLVNLENPDLISGYISGLWDGNGSVCQVNNRPIVMIYNTTREPLIFIQKIIGGSIIKMSKKYEKNRQLYALRWSSWKVVQLFYQMLISNSIKARKLYKLWLSYQTWQLHKDTSR